MTGISLRTLVVAVVVASLWTRAEHVPNVNKLKVVGNKFSFNGDPVFLSGANQPWLNYGADFGALVVNAHASLVGV